MIESGREPTPGVQARPVVVLALVAIGCDIVVAIAALAERHAFVHAVTNEFLVPGDDPELVAVAGLYAVGSLLRYGALVALVVALLRRPSETTQRANGRWYSSCLRSTSDISRWRSRDPTQALRGWRPG